MFVSNYLIINGLYQAVFFKGNCISSIIAQNAPQATAGENKTRFIYHFVQGPVFARSAEIAVKPCVLSLCNCGVFSTRWNFGSNSSLANFSHFSLSHRRSHLLCPTYCPSHQGLGKRDLCPTNSGFLNTNHK